MRFILKFSLAYIIYIHSIIVKIAEEIRINPKVLFFSSNMEYNCILIGNKSGDFLNQFRWNIDSEIIAYKKKL